MAHNPQDSRGSFIHPGDTVAYNYSGYIAVGIVQEIKIRKLRNTNGTAWTIFIERTHPKPDPKWNDGTSKVMNPGSVLVIYEK